MLRLLLVCLLMGSCAKHSPEVASSKKVPVQLETKFIQQLELKNHYTTTDTFTLFFFPQVGKMNWDSQVFNKEDSDEKKLSAIISEVIHRSDLIDQADAKSYSLLERNKEIQKELVANNCSEGDDFGDDFELKDSTNICDSLNQEVLDNVMEMGRLSSSEKGEHLRGIQVAIDDVSFKKLDETTFVKEGKVVNWVPYGDQNSYIFKLFSDSKESFTPQIVLPTLGVNANKYTSEDGDVFDIKLENSKYAPNTLMLMFKVKEKDESGKYTGLTWHCELEKSNFAGKIRFSGDVFRKDSLGKTVQQGIMKFELAQNEFGAGDDDFGDDF